MKKITIRFVILWTGLLSLSVQADNGFVELWNCGTPSSSHYTKPFKMSHGFNTKVSWHLNAHRVPQAWSLGQTGYGITIGVIDTGLPSFHPTLTAAFASGLSSGRSLVWTPIPFVDDIVRLTNHGTKVTSVLAAPVWASDTPAGVAYRASVMMRSGNDDPIIAHVDHFDEQLRLLANNASVKIINISMGKAVNVPKLEEAIRYASITKNKLIFATAGVTGSDGMYPATLDDAFGVMSVTGVEYHESDPEGKNLRVAAPNSYGETVDFAAYVYRPSDEGCVLTMSDNSSATVSGRGSSLAVPTIAGIAALVWDVNPALSKSSVIDTLKRASSLYPNRSEEVGYGVVNAELAVRIAIKPVITSMSVQNSSGTTVLFSASGYDPDGGNVRYVWNFGNGHTMSRTSSTAFTYRYPDGGTYMPSVTIVDDEKASATRSSIISICEDRYSSTERLIHPPACFEDDIY